MFDQSFLDDPPDIEKAVERKRTAGSDSVGVIPRHPYDTASPRVLRPDSALISQIVRPKPKFYFDHFLAMLCFKLFYTDGCYHLDASRR